MTTNTATPPARAAGKHRISSSMGCLYVLLAGIAFLVYFAWNNLSGGPFDAERMNGIVEAVRRHQVGEKQVAFSLEDLSRPETLSPIPESSPTYGNVWAHRRKGALQVAIMTRDSGHIGEYGFVFSEVPLKVVDQMGGQTYYDVPGPMRDLGNSIDDHWWRAANRER